MRLISSIVLFLSLSCSAWTQYLINVHAGMIIYTEGAVFLDKEPFKFNSDQPQTLKKGQLLRTASGKVEVQLGPAASLWMGENGSLRMENSSLTKTLVSIEEGSVIVEIIEKLGNNRIILQLGETEIELNDTGLFHLDSAPPQLYVFDGKAKVRQQHEKETVKRGKCAEFGIKVKISDFDTNCTSPLQNWANQRSRIVYGQIKNARDRENKRLLMENTRLQQEVEGLVRQQALQQQQQQQLEEQRKVIEEQQEMLKRAQEEMRQQIQ